MWAMMWTKVAWAMSWHSKANSRMVEAEWVFLVEAWSHKLFLWEEVIWRGALVSPHLLESFAHLSSELFLLLSLFAAKSAFAELLS